MANKNFELRFAVGHSPDSTSSIFRLWGEDPEKKENAKSDVYFSYRILAGDLKISFHETGMVNFSYNSEYAIKKEIENRLRHIDQWEIDFTKPLFCILIPFTEIIRGLKNYHPDTVLLPYPGLGNAMDITIYITKQEIRSQMPPYFQMFFEKKLANGNILSIVWMTSPITDHNWKSYQKSKTELARLVGQIRKENSNMRGFSYVQGEYGRMFIDLAL